MEIWKDIPEYEGYYQASNKGRIKSLNRVIKINGIDSFIKGRLLKQSIDGRGYYTVGLSKDSKRKTNSVHILIGVTFLNYKIDLGKIVLDHIDNDKLNNNVNNLQIISVRENTSKDKDKTKTSSKYIGVGYEKSRNKWVARAVYNKKLKNIGRFKTEKEAKIAYDNFVKNIL